MKPTSSAKSEQPTPEDDGARNAVERRDDHATYVDAPAVVSPTTEG
jgi:hypothetical protein